MTEDVKRNQRVNELFATTARASYGLILIYLILSAGIMASGYLYYRNYEKSYRLEVEEQLSAIADLKVKDIVQWRMERLCDANMFYKNPVFSELVRRFFENPDDADALERIQAWTGKVKESLEYDWICLLDSQLKTRMSIPMDLPPLSSAISHPASEALLSGQVTFVDFYRNEHDQLIHLNIIVPIIDKQDNNRVLGILEMRIDPSQYLYPLISRWPTPSRTAETLLVRRDGNDVLFLNELRFKKDAALNLRISIEKSPDLPSVKAIREGFKGIVEGMDYRGVPVVADVRAVPASPWFMVARMDASEVYEPLRQELWLIIGIIGALLLGTGAGTAFLWRQQATRFYIEKYKAAEALRESREQFKTMFEQAPLGIVLIDSMTGNLYEANSMFAKIAGRTLEELAAIDWMSITHPDDVQGKLDKIAQLNAGKIAGFQMNTRYLRPDGSVVWISMTIAPLTAEDKAHPRHLCMIEDITKRKQTEEELLRSNSELEQFAYIASHDLQEPLRKILAFGDRVKAQYEAALDEKGRDYLERMQNAAGRMRQLIDDLLKLSRVMTRARPFAPVELGNVVREALSELDLLIMEKRADIIVGDLPVIKADKTQMLQLLQNIILNSLKYVSPGIVPRISIAGSVAAGGIAEILIQDNGIGFDEKYLDRIFLPFQRLHSRSEYVGTGMGLAICSKIVKRHGGSITAESTPGMGAVFKIKLPVAQ